MNDYAAAIVTTDRLLPINELSLTWHTTEPVLGSGEFVNEDSVDYKVIAVKLSLNGVKYLLKKLTKNRELREEDYQLQVDGKCGPATRKDLKAA